MTRPLTVRQSREFEHHARAHEVVVRDVTETMIPWNMREFVRVLRVYFPDEGAFRGMRVLDCGCGSGVLAILMAKRGAAVEAFDISEDRVELARRYCEASGVGDRVAVRTGVMERLDYPGERFDLVLGTRVLHHVDIPEAAAEVRRVLKPGGMAVFWEPTLRNPIHKTLRQLYRAVPVLPRAGSPDEHPMTEEEIEALRRAFDGHLRVHGAPFYVFSHMARAVGLNRIGLVSRPLSLLDRGLDTAFPRLRRSSIHQILAMSKPA